MLMIIKSTKPTTPDLITTWIDEANEFFVFITGRINVFFDQ